MKIVIDASKETLVTVSYGGVEFNVELENVPEQGRITDLEEDLKYSREALYEYKRLNPSYNKIQAIKTLREKTSLGLMEAKNIVDAAFANPLPNNW